MQTRLAILIADLAGYTALTETHGPEAAADVVDRYMDIVSACLVGDSHVHERVGDEVMIVSPDPDHLLSTAFMLLQTTHREENFLLLHGGLHYGELLRRNNSYFGTAINLASRIASVAQPGHIWCSQKFIAALSKVSTENFSSKGKHGFKNIGAEEELFEINTPTKAALHIDPVCRMLLVNEQTAFRNPENPGLYFCSEHCLNIFLSGQAEQPV